MPTVLLHPNTGVSPCMVRSVERLRDPKIGSRFPDSFAMSASHHAIWRPKIVHPL